MELNEKQMCSVVGGASWMVITAVVAGIIYILGTISGYTNPTRCNN